MLTLLQKQDEFSGLLALLIIRGRSMGFGVTMGEVWRPQFAADYYASVGLGIRDSVHELRMGADLNLFKDGILLTSPENYRALGEWWKQQSHDEIECCWGGDFKDIHGNPKPDADHFSFFHQGRK